MVPPVPMGQQWLYGSAEGAIASAQVYRTMADYVRMAVISAAPRRQVVLAQVRARGIVHQHEIVRPHAIGQRGEAGEHRIRALRAALLHHAGKRRVDA